jgi:hypothetical protein
MSPSPGAARARQRLLVAGAVHHDVLSATFQADVQVPTATELPSLGPELRLITIPI